MKLPFFVIKGAADSGLEPPGNAVEVERVIANSPRRGALLRCVGHRVSLAVDAGLHDVVLADGAVVNVNIYTQSCENGPQASRPLLLAKRIFTYPKTKDRRHSTFSLQIFFVQKLLPFFLLKQLINFHNCRRCFNSNN